MRLAGVKPGDIVRAGHGAGVFTGYVIEVQRGWVHTSNVMTGARRRLRASDVHTHWRLIRSEGRP